MRIDKDFEGGNIRVTQISGDTVHLEAELRDTQTDWFYWAFRVEGAAGRTIRFDFNQKLRVGYYGAAVSHDLRAWKWAGEPFADYTGFTYSFGQAENTAFFCHDLRYSTAQFQSLCQDLALPAQTLATSERGRPIPFVEFGSGENVLLLTSRHHACESTGTYVLEGALRSLARKPITGFTTIAVPFVDLDGVVDGDQGKNRRPHDHNRDYGEKPLYASVRWIQALAGARPVVFALDLHSPWHFGGRNDVGHGVRKDGLCTATQARFGELLTQQCRQCPDSFQYDTKNDLAVGEEWNVPQDGGSPTSFSAFFSCHPGTEFALSLETPYYGTTDNIVTQERLRALGGCVAGALRALAAER